MLYRLGFLEAMMWTEEKVRIMGLQIARRHPASNIPKPYQDLFELLQKYEKRGEYIEWEIAQL